MVHSRRRVSASSAPIGVSGCTPTANSVSLLNTLPMPAAIRWSSNTSATGWSGRGVAIDPRQHGVEVRVRITQVGTEVVDRRRTAVAHERADRGRGVTERVAVGDGEHDPQLRTRLRRAHTRHRRPPAAHAEVRVEREVAVELDQQVLADRVHRLDQLSGTRREHERPAEPDVFEPLALEQRRDALLRVTERVSLGHPGEATTRGWRCAARPSRTRATNRAGTGRARLPRRWRW